MTRGRCSGDHRQRRRLLTGRSVFLGALLTATLVLVSATLAGGSEPRDTYETTIAADSPVAQYRFEDATESASLADAAGSNTGANHGVTLGGAGPFGGSGSGSFGGEAYASLASDPLEGASEFTAEGWVYWSGESSYEEPVFDFGSSATNHVDLTPAASAGSHDLTLELHTSEGASAQVTAPELGEGNWHYVAATEDSTGTLKLYVDGADVGHTDEATVNPASLGSTPTAYLGKSLGTASDFKGRLSNVAFYTKALSAAAIKAHYDAGEFPVNTAMPTISGSAEDEQTLSAHAETWTGLEPIELGYQWLRCNGSGEGCSAIEGAGEAAYVASHEDVEHTLRVEVTGTNAAGHGTARSVPTARIAARKPSSTSPPTISGTLEDGQTLSASAGSWSGTPTLTYSYQWQRCNRSGESCADISAATSATYDATFEDVGHRLRVLVTATNAGGSSEAASSASAFVAPTPLAELGYASEFGTEGTGDGQFKEPFAVAVGAGGDIFVLDRGNDRVEKFNEAGEYLGQFGEEGSGDGQLRSPVALAVDGKGHVWVTDGGNGRLEEFDERGEFIRTAGEGLIGSAEGIAIDRSGHVWVSVSYAGHLAVFGEDGEHLKDVGTRGSEPGQLGEPEGIAVDPDGRVLVADYANGRVDVFAEAGEYLSQFGTAGNGAGEFSGPYGIAVDEGHVFVGEWGGDRIQEFEEEDGSFIAQLGAPGAEAGELGFPTGLAIDPAHELLIADAANNRVQRWDPEAPGAPGNASPPSINGTPGIGDTYEAGVGVWHGSRRTYAFQWQRCDEHGEECVDIEGATSTSYTVGEDDRGSTVRVLVTATNSLGSASSASAVSEAIGEPPVNVSPPTISGTPKEDVELSVDPGEWERANGYGYKWQRCNALGEECADVERYWEEGYTPSEEDVGHTLRVIVTAWNGAGEAQATSLASATVQSSRSPTNTELPTISGSPNVGKSLSVSTGSWEGPSPISYAYQWQDCDHSGASCTDIAGAESSTYRVSSSELGDTLRAVVTATNSAGSTSATSATTTPVEAGTPVALDAPTVSGTAEDGQTLTATSGSWAGSESISYAYQWETCNSKGESCSSISGATEAHYRVVDSQIGHTVRATVTASNSVGSEEAPSAPTAVIAPGPPTNVEAPSIFGTTTEGELLGSSVGSWTGGGPFTYTYQWKSCNSAGESCSNLSGATGSTYELTKGDVGKTLRIAVIAKNSVSSTEATSNASAVIIGAPSNTAAPAISGSVEDGRMLKASTGTWSAEESLSYTYQWQGCDSEGESCTSIPGATSESYVSQLGDVGERLRVVVTASDSFGSTQAMSSATAVITAATPPSNTSSPSIVGTARAGMMLSVNEGTWSGSTPKTYSYQWQSCNQYGQGCHSIEGATHPGYPLTSGNLEATLRVVVTASNVAGRAEAVSAVSAEVQPGAPSELEAPSISGEPSSGQTLYANAGSWGGTESEVSYQWERCDAKGEECARVAGATDAEYVLGESDIGATLRVRIGIGNPLGSVTAVSSATETISGGEATLSNTLKPSITGTPRSGQTLTANAGSWLGLEAISYTYQWESCNGNGGSCKGIEGATSATYVLSSADIGKTLRLRVSASETGGAASRMSMATQPIAAEEAPTSDEPPTVSGTVLSGDTLIVGTGTWSGYGPRAYGYQWERCDESGESCSSITGATAQTYTLTETDVGSSLRALVTATDEGESTTVASEATAVVSRATLVNVVPPSVTGTDEIGRILNAANGIWTGAGALAYSYAWERCNEKGESCSTITGATESTYTPSSADVGKTLKVIVTAEGDAGKESVPSALTPVIGSESLAPVNVFVPTIEGDMTSGATVTAQTGTWTSSEAISYTYQWQKCNAEGEECTSISEATSSTYTLIGGDVGATLRVVVTGTNALGTVSATSEEGEVVGAAGPPESTSPPVITGTVALGQRLTASNGDWSGSRPLSYYYRWERCNTAGESCTAVEGATKPDYTLASADVGTTLRVTVTATNSLGSAGSISPQTIVVAGGEASTTSAIDLTEEADPSAVQPPTAETIEGQEVKPAVSDEGESLAATSALTSSSTSKETPGEFAVNTPAGELSLQPINTAPNAAKTPTIVNGAAAMFAQTATATDTIVRPDALGATTLLQLRSSEAPTSFSWEVGLGPNQKLEKLSNGDIAVVEVPSTSPLEGSLGEGLAAQEPSEAEAEHEGSGEDAEAAERALEERGPEEGVSAEGVLEKLSAAPTASTPAIEPKSGEPHPQETKALYESGKSTVAYAEEHATGTTLMVIEAPSVTDAEGNAVSASMSMEDDTVTMTIAPAGATYPLIAEVNVPAPTDAASQAAAHAVRYGLSDPNASSFETAEEEKGKTTPHFDSHLKNGKLHVGIARDVIPYNWHPGNAELVNWLKAVKKADLEPYLTLTVESDQFCHPGRACSETSLTSYEAHVKELISGLVQAHDREPSVIPLVTLWGAWNEPDLDHQEQNPLYKNPTRAALFWKKARSILRQVGCNCTMVAGEFAQDDGYINSYMTAIQRNRSFWPGKPHVWGFHDYEDLEHSYSDAHNSYAEAFIKKLKRLGAPRVWFSEQGVLLQNGAATTKLADGSQSEDAARQRDAAKDFLRLGSVHLGTEPSRVEVVDYYLYRGPTAEKLRSKPYAFDSALLPGEGVTEEAHHPAENPRQAYCVLALGIEGCPATSKTQVAVSSAIRASAGTVSLVVNPNDLPTKYLVEYGTTTAYGKETAVAPVPNENGAQTVTAELSGLEPCTTYHFQAEAENDANEEEKEPGLGGDQTFTTPGYVTGECEAHTPFTGVTNVYTVSMWNYGGFTGTIKQALYPSQIYLLGCGPGSTSETYVEQTLKEVENEEKQEAEGFPYRCESTPIPPWVSSLHVTSVESTLGPLEVAEVVREEPGPYSWWRVWLREPLPIIETPNDVPVFTIETVYWEAH